MLSLVTELDLEAARLGSATHSVHGAISISYAHFVTLTHQVAWALHRDGVRAGDRVAVWSKNDLRMLQVVYGALRCKAVFVPLNARNSLIENADLLRRFECKALCIQAGVADLGELRRTVPSLQCIVPFDPSPGFVPFAQWLGPHQPFPDPYYGGDEPAAIFPTSGTTGVPKGVVHSHFSLAVMAHGYREVLQAKRGARHLVVGPLTHVTGGIVYATTKLGVTHYICESTRPGAILDAIERERIDFLFAPPTLVYSLLDEQCAAGVIKRDVSSLKTLVYAGSPILPQRLRQAVEVFGDILVNVYSQTEVLYPVSSLSRKDHARIAAGEQKLLKSAGRATDAGALAIMDDQCRLLEPGQAGEIVTRSLAGMKEYFGNPGAVAELREGGWHHTGDAGYLDEAGYLFIVDRKKDMIISGGFNVYPAEVEAVLLQHPDVAEAAVVGRPDPKWGETVQAFVIARPDTAPDVPQLLEHCRARLGSVKAPKEIVVCEQFPRNSNGKVLKRVLREQVALQ